MIKGHALINDQNEYKLLSPNTIFSFKIGEVHYFSLKHYYYYNKYKDFQPLKERRINFDNPKFNEQIEKGEKALFKESELHKKWKGIQIQVMDECLSEYFKWNLPAKEILLRSENLSLKCIDALSKFWNSKNEIELSHYDNLLIKHREILRNLEEKRAGISEPICSKNDSNNNVSEQNLLPHPHLEESKNNSLLISEEGYEFKVNISSKSNIKEYSTKGNTKTFLSSLTNQVEEIICEAISNQSKGNYRNYDHQDNLKIDRLNQNLSELKLEKSEKEVLDELEKEKSFKFQVLKRGKVYKTPSETEINENNQKGGLLSEIIIEQMSKSTPLMYLTFEEKKGLLKDGYFIQLNPREEINKLNDQKMSFFIVEGEVFVYNS